MRGRKRKRKNKLGEAEENEKKSEESFNTIKKNERKTSLELDLI